MAHSRSRMSGVLNDYARLRTLPAILSVAFIVASAYQFGAISDVTLTWFSNYTLTAEHATLGSMAILAVAFASSETKQLDSYDDWEMVVIALGPIVILGQQYISEIDSLLMDLGDPLGYQIAFVLTVASWAVAVR